MTQKDAKLKAKINAMQEKITGERRSQKTLQKNIKIDEKALADKEQQMNNVRWKISA